MFALCATLVLPPAGFAQPAAPSRGATGDEVVLQSSPRLRSRTPVTVNFVGADIEAVTRAFAAMIDRQIAVDPRVRGNITVYSEQPITIREAFLTYLAALRGLGFALVDSGGLLKVVPEADAKLQTGTVSVGEVAVRGDQVITQVFTLRYENPNNLVAVLRPLISANNTINASPTSNSLVITDYADNLQRISRIIAALDQPSTTDVEVIPLQHAVASDVAPLVQRLVDAGGGGGVAVAPGVAVGGAAGTTVLPDVRSNSLIVRAPNAARLAVIRSTVARLDRPAQGLGSGGMWVVPLKHADAARLATVLRAAFAAQGSGSATGGAGGSPQPARQPQQGAQNTGTGAGSPQATAPLAASEQPSTGGFVQADPATNSLIITAPEPLYRHVRAMIEQLDTRRAQIYIESMIVEVSGDNAAEFGFQWQGVLGNNTSNGVVGGGTNFGNIGNIIGINQGAISGQIGLGEGFNIGIVRDLFGTPTLLAIARALQTQGNTNIVSTPNLITLDNEEAKIVVGENVPFVTGQFTNTGTSVTSPFQTIERKDVGITLRIRPQIGEGGVVRMTIFQEQSAVKPTVAAGTSNAGPSTTKRSIESTITVDDGQIIVLGGLVQDEYTDNTSKVPFLGDLPGVGALFRSETRTKRRTNLMVFLRPVVMRDADAVNRISLDRYDLIRAHQVDQQPRQSAVLPVGPAPVVAPQRPPGTPPALPIPLSAPESSPGTAANPRVRERELPAASTPQNDPSRQAY